MLIDFSTKNYGRSSPKNSYYRATQNCRRSRADSDYRFYDPTIKTIVRSRSSCEHLKVQNRLSTVEDTIAPRPDLSELHDQCSSRIRKSKDGRKPKRKRPRREMDKNNWGDLNPNSTPKTCFLCHLQGLSRTSGYYREVRWVYI
jgi:hypothetical protein